MFWDIIISYIISLEHIFVKQRWLSSSLLYRRCHEDVVTFLTWEWKLTMYHVCLRCWKMKYIILSSWNIETFRLIFFYRLQLMYIFIKYTLISRDRTWNCNSFLKSSIWANILCFIYWWLVLRLSYPIINVCFELWHMSISKSSNQSLPAKSSCLLR